MPTVPPLVITDEEHAELQRRVRAHTTPQRAAKRARVVLLAADGVPNRQIGSALVFHKTTGQPFTVTYTVDAQAKSLSNQ